MIKCFEHIAIFILLFAAFAGLFFHIGLDDRIERGIKKAKKNMDEHDRRFRSEKRKNLGGDSGRESLLLKIERQLEYSGLGRRFPRLTITGFILAEILLAVITFILGSVIGGMIAGLLAAFLMATVQYVIVSVMKAQRFASVNEELPKLLDFLGNYSLTSGDITSVFSQISRYLKEPLRSVMEECEAESKVSGDSRTAIISMAEKIEHPQFKQLARNLEVASRYSADLWSVVSDSRKSLREYLSQNRDRKNLLRESGINMLLLLIMSVVVLAIVNMLIEGGIFGILFHSLPGYISLSGMAIIIVLYFIQAASMSK